MIQLRIDHMLLAVPEQTTVLEAAHSAGIKVPSMCHLKGYHNHPSCMVCMVKDRNTGNLFASCAMPVSEGMDIITDDEEVIKTRQASLELLMSDHVGDCEAPCSLACPANMDIPQMNRLLASGQFEEALAVVRETIALPYILGTICPAPCEKACRRKQIDSPVSVCLLKKASASFSNMYEHSWKTPSTSKYAGKKIAIIGAGPAGLAAAFYLLKAGVSCTLFDAHDKAGGTLRYNIPENELPPDILDREIEVIRSLGAEFRLGTAITKESFTKEIQNKYSAVILATGDFQPGGFLPEEIKTSKTGVAVDESGYATSVPGIFACGNILRSQKMAVRSAAQGRDAAKSAISFLNGEQPVADKRKFNSRFEKLFPEEFAVYLKESVPDNRHVPENLLTGFSKEDARAEAARCLHCDCRKQDNCKLRDLCDEYKADRKKYLTSERNKMLRFDDHDFVVYEPEKCIRCGLCIEIVRTDKEATGLAFFGKGFDVRMQVPFNSSFRVALTHTAKKCVENCPTGALSFKQKQ